VARRGRHAREADDDDDFAADAPPAPIGHRKERRFAPLLVVLSVLAVAAAVVAVVVFGSSSTEPTPPGAVPARPVRGSCLPAAAATFTCTLYAEEAVAFNSGNPTVRTTVDGGDVAFRPAADLVYYYQHGTATSITAGDCDSRERAIDLANLSDLEPGFLACRVEPFGAVSYVEVADASQVTAADPQLGLRITFVPAPAGSATPTSSPSPSP